MIEKIEILTKSNTGLMDEIARMKKREMNLLNNTDPDEISSFGPMLAGGSDGSTRDLPVPKLNLTKIMEWREKEYIASLMRKRLKSLEKEEEKETHRLVVDDPSSL